jgi:membrane-anchored protein YejM (alkaline phosphatase superfamily)
MENESNTEPKKKMTPMQVLKKYNLTVNELDELLEQIYNELDKSENNNQPAV